MFAFTKVLLADENVKNLCVKEGIAVMVVAIILLFPVMVVLAAAKKSNGKHRRR